MSFPWHTIQIWVPNKQWYLGRPGLAKRNQVFIYIMRLWIVKALRQAFSIKIILQIDILSNCRKLQIFPGQCTQDTTNNRSTLAWAMAWCRHNLNQCWPRSMSPYGVTRPLWINSSTSLWNKKKEKRSLTGARCCQLLCVQRCLCNILITDVKLAPDSSASYSRLWRWQIWCRFQVGISP